MKSPSLEHTVACLSSAIPYSVLAWTLMQVWISPMSVDDGAWVRMGVALMMMEFLAVHSGMFMGGMAGAAKSIWKRYLLFMGLLLLYLAFAAIFAATANSVEAFGVFVFLMVGRFVTVVISSRESREQLMSRSFDSAVVYLAAVFGSLFLPLPELGLTPEMVDLTYPDHGGGEWERYPHIAIAAGVFYFFVLALLELRFIWKEPRAERSEQDSRLFGANVNKQWNAAEQSIRVSPITESSELPIMQPTQGKQSDDGPK